MLCSIIWRRPLERRRAIIGVDAQNTRVLSEPSKEVLYMMRSHDHELLSKTSMHMDADHHY
jgi:hypothetical protein